MATLNVIDKNGVRQSLTLYNNKTDAVKYDLGDGTALSVVGADGNTYYAVTNDCPDNAVLSFIDGNNKVRYVHKEQPYLYTEYLCALTVAGQTCTGTYPFGIHIQAYGSTGNSGESGQTKYSGYGRGGIGSNGSSIYGNYKDTGSNKVTVTFSSCTNNPGSSGEKVDESAGNGGAGGASGYTVTANINYAGKDHSLTAVGGGGGGGGGGAGSKSAKWDNYGGKGGNGGSAPGASSSNPIKAEDGVAGTTYTVTVDEKYHIYQTNVGGAGGTGGYGGRNSDGATSPVIYIWKYIRGQD